MTYKEYNIFVCLVVALTSLIIISFNVLVDPIGYWGTPQIKNINDNKPNQYMYDRLYKSVDLKRFHLDGILLGTSRVEVGIEPNDLLEYGYSKVYNSAFSAATLYENLSYLQHAIYNNSQIKVVIIGLDYENFQDNREKYKKGFRVERLSRSWPYFRDWIECSLSMDITRLSLKTLLDNPIDKEKVNYFEPNGARTDKCHYKEVLEARKGKTFENAFQAAVNPLTPTSRISEEEIEVFRKIVEICNEHNIKLYAFITPYHYSVVEKFNDENRIYDFVVWKSELSKIHQIWDFSGYNEVTTETPRYDMKYYWEASHYKKNVGSMILRRMFDPSSPFVFEDFGVLLDNVTPEYIMKITQENRNQWLNKKHW